MSKTQSSEAKQLWDENDMLQDADISGLNLLREMISPYWSARISTDQRTGKREVVVEGLKNTRRPS